MRVLKFIPLALLLLVSCSKEEVLNQEELSYPITFNVTTLEVDYKALTRSSTTSPAELGEKIKSIEYIVFKDGAYFSSGTQTFSSSPLTFGQITVKVPSGECDVRIAGYGEGTNNSYFDRNNTSWGIRAEQREVFYASIPGVNIADNTTYEAQLARKTGAITLNIKDAENAPSNFGSIRIGYNLPTYWYMNINSTSDYRSGSRGYSGTSSSFPIIFIHTWPHTSGVLTLEVLDTGNSLIKTKKINYDVYENRKTVITGELFGGDQEFTVSITDAWGEDNIVEIE